MARTVVALKVYGHQVNRGGHRTDRALDGSLLTHDVDRKVDLEDRDVPSTREAVRPGVHARTENDHTVDLAQSLVQLGVDVALAARDE